MVLIPMSLLASILQATPLFVTLGAAISLGEKVGWRRWSAIFIGFLGVIIILQPGYGSFQLASLLGLAAVLCLALRDVVTRDMATEIPTLTVTFYACLACDCSTYQYNCFICSGHYGRSKKRISNKPSTSHC